MIQSTVFIEQLALDTYIGLHKWEMADRQKVICDIEMVIDISQAAETDDIVHSVDYEFISNHLREWAYNHRCKLLEKLANQLVDLLVLHYPSIEKNDYTPDESWCSAAHSWLWRYGNLYPIAYGHPTRDTFSIRYKRKAPYPLLILCARLSIPQNMATIIKSVLK